MKKHFFFLVLITGLSLQNCSESGTVTGTGHYFDATIRTDSKNIPLDKDQYYFPEQLFPKVRNNYIFEDSTLHSPYHIEREILEGTVDDFVLKWYSTCLYAMKEPLLFNRPTEKEIYRFTWLRSFHHPVMVRIEKDKKTCTAYWKVLDGAGGYEPGVPIVDESRRLSLKEWKGFIRKLDITRFWEMSIGKTSEGHDGAEWILEGMTPEKYHVVTVWTPSAGPYYDACMYLLSLTDIDISEDDIY